MVAEVVIDVTDAVPASLAQLVADAAGPVVVRARPPSSLAGEELAGWEIGVATAALLAGAHRVEGVSAARLRRVEVVVGHLAAPSSEVTR